MNRIVAVLIAAAVVAPATAQGPAEPGAPLNLLGQAKVQKALKLTDAQTTAVKKVVAAVKGDPAKTAEAFTALGKTLEPGQMKRLKEISYQVRGGAAVGDGDVMKALALSDKQKAEVRSIWVNSEKDLRMLLSVARFRTPKVRADFIANHRKKAGEKMLGMLSAEQKKQFDQLKGKPFDVTGLDSE